MMPERWTGRTHARRADRSLLDGTGRDAGAPRVHARFGDLTRRSLRDRFEVRDAVEAVAQHLQAPFAGHLKLI